MIALSTLASTALALCTVPAVGPGMEEHLDPYGVQGAYHPTTEIEIVGFTPISLTTLPDGRDLLELGVDVRNNGAFAFDYADATLRGLPPQVEIVDGTVSVGVLAPGAGGTSTDAISLAFDPALRPSVWAAVTGGALATADWAIHAYEPPVLAPGVHTIDEATDLAFARVELRPDGRLDYVFTEWTPLLAALVPGDVLLDGSYEPVNLFCADFALGVDAIADVGGEVVVTRALATYGPFDLFASFGASGAAADALLQPTDTTRGLPEVSCTVGPDDSGCTVGPPQLRYNDIEIAPGVFVGGQLGMRAHSSSFTVWFRNGAVQGATLTTTLEGWVTLQGRFEQAGSLADAEVDLLTWTVPVFDAEVGAGVGVRLDGTFRAYLDLEGSWEAGAELAATQRVSLAVEVEVGATGTTLTPVATLDTPDLSVPRLDDLASADVSLGFGIAAGADGLVTFSGAPMVGVGMTHDAWFHQRVQVTPFGDPWWTRDQVSGKQSDVTLSLLGVDVDGIALGASSTAEPLDDGRPGAGAIPGTLTEGEAQRWSRVAEVMPGSTDRAVDVAELADGRLAVILDGTTDAIAVLDPDTGVPAWELAVDGRDADRLAATDDGGLIVAGGQGYVLRLDGAGGVLWSMEHDLGGVTDVLDVLWWRDPILGTEEGLLVGTVSEVSGHKPFALRFDGTGAVRWAQKLPGTWGPSLDTATAALRTSDGDLVLVGDTDAPAHPADNASKNAMMIRLDDAGAVEWASAVNGLQLRDVVELEDGGLLAVGGTYFANPEPYHASLIVRVEPDGTLGWSTTAAEEVTLEGGVVAQSGALPGDHNNDLLTAAVATRGGAAVAGYTGPPSARAAWLVQIDGQGQPVWWSTWDGAGLDELHDLAEVGDSLIAVGATSTFTGDTDAWVTRTPFPGGPTAFPPAELGVRFAQPHLDDMEPTRPSAALPFDPMPAALAPVSTPGTVAVIPAPSSWLTVAP